MGQRRGDQESCRKADLGVPILGIGEKELLPTVDPRLPSRRERRLLVHGVERRNRRSDRAFKTTEVALKDTLFPCTKFAEQERTTAELSGPSAARVLSLGWLQGSAALRNKLLRDLQVVVSSRCELVQEPVQVEPESIIEGNSRAIGIWLASPPWRGGADISMEVPFSMQSLGEGLDGTDIERKLRILASELLS
jgi:hypothetical protein